MVASVPKLYIRRIRPLTLVKVGLFLLTVFLLVSWLREQRTSHLRTEPPPRNEPQAASTAHLQQVEEPQRLRQNDPPPQPQHAEPPRVIKKPRKEAPTNKYDLQFLADERRIVPGLGAGGAAVNLEGEELKKVEEVMKKEAFNLISSDQISYNRSLPDVRDRRCRKVTYDEDLPSASVIIIYNNEAWSPLMRTIWSTLNRSPARHLKEIVLIDDFSDHEDLKGKLDRYIAKKLPPKVRVIRLKERQGLIRARLAGAREAVGDVIVFLDSHCECTEGWLEPLLHRIKQDRKAVLVPIIDVIDDKTLEYFHGNPESFQIGSFTWSGHFTWMDVPPREVARRANPIGPTYSPTMAGGLFAIDRQYFWEIGSYDEGMDVWGGENLEMSFRIWTCGGSLETIPCSRVGHIFRSFHPYSFPGNKDTHGINTARAVEVWMDDYKSIFYMHRPDLQSIDIGDLNSRIKLRRDLKCKSFQWYLDEVIPEKFIPTDHAQAYGRVTNVAHGKPLCLDYMQHNEDLAYDLGLYPCHAELSMSQFFVFSKDGRLRREESCAQVDPDPNSPENPVQMVPCPLEPTPEQKWILTKRGELVHQLTAKCLDRGTKMDSSDASVSPCASIRSQFWTFDTYTNGA